MTFSKFLKFGCLGVIGVFVLLLIVGLIGRALMTPEEKAAMAAKRQAAEAKAAEEQKAADAQAVADEKAAEEKTVAQQKQSADDFLRRLTLLRRCVPAVDQLHEQAAPAGSGVGKITYYPADYGFMTQFAETGFVPLTSDDPNLWYRGTVFDDMQKALTSDLPPEKRNAILAKTAADFDTKPYLAVFVPLEQNRPVLDADGKKFTSGYFRGWVILLDSKKQELISETTFEAKNSATVTKYRPKVAGIAIGSGIGSAVASDFTDNFWSAANAAIEKSLPPN